MHTVPTQVSAAAAPNWLDVCAYPFASHYLTTPAGRLHYVDEGQGEAVVFVHGTPTWSWLYRRQIRALAPHYRCVAADNLGFGLSDKPADWDYHPRRHAENLRRLLDHLGLGRITLVVHDFGGPVGLGFAAEHPERVQRLVVLNTWLWDASAHPQARQADRLLHSWLGRWLYLGLNFSPRVLLRQGFGDKRVLTPALHQHYLQPFARRADRHGPLRLGQWLLRASDWYEARRQELPVLVGKPALLVWGRQDPFLTEADLGHWQQLLPQAQMVLLDCGHFIPEERPAELTQALLTFLRGA
ncbi:alpha/beta fold hydrolase [Hymenobacter coalescens]